MQTRANMRASSSIPFLVLLAVSASLLFAAAGQPFPPSVHITFNLATDTYDHFFQQLKTLLEQPSNPPYNPRDVDGRYVLGPRRADFESVPLGWIQVHLTGVPEGEATLALANDDLYVLGFANANGQWFMVKKFTGLPNPITLPFEENYGQLLPRLPGRRNRKKGPAYKRLWKVPLGKQSAIHGARVLARYDRATTPDAEVKDAFVRFVVMICEGARFTPMREVFSGINWEQETHISKTQCNLIGNWGKISKLLIAWELKGRQGFGEKPEDMIYGTVSRETGVKTPTQALNKVAFLLRPPPVVQ